MPTVGDAITLTRRRLRSVYRRRVNTTAAPMTATSESVVLRAATAGISAGSIVGIGTELCYVSSAEASSKTITLVRGFEGTEAQAHDRGAIVDVEPRFPDGFILDDLHAEVLSWGPEIYRVADLPISGDLASSMYDLSVDGEVYQLLEVVASPSLATGGVATRLPGTLVRHADLDLWPSGLALALPELTSGRRLTVTYATSFVTDPWDTDTDLVDDVGLAPSMVDLAVLGAAYRSLTEVPRTDRAGLGEQREAEEVPPGHITSVREDLNRERTRRKYEEIAKLRARYPLRSS